MEGRQVVQTRWPASISTEQPVSEEAKRYVMLDWGLCMLRHRKAYMVPSLWPIWYPPCGEQLVEDLSDMSCDPRQAAQLPVRRRSSGAVQQIDSEELAAG